MDVQPGAELKVPLKPAQELSLGSPPELVVPNKLLPGAHHPFARLLLVFILGAVLVSLL